MPLLHSVFVMTAFCGSSAWRAPRVNSHKIRQCDIFMQGRAEVWARLIVLYNVSFTSLFHGFAVTNDVPSPNSLSSFLTREEGPTKTEYFTNTIW